MRYAQLETESPPIILLDTSLPITVDAYREVITNG